jgi:hypothetical protein
MDVTRIAAQPRLRYDRFHPSNEALVMGSFEAVLGFISELRYHG